MIQMFTQIFKVEALEIHHRQSQDGQLLSSISHSKSFQKDL